MTRVVCALALVFFAGCKAPATEGKRAHCTCTYLTDFDDAARVDVDVCVAAGRDLQAEATTCAGEAAHNHIDRCDCGSGATVTCDPRTKDSCVAR